MLLGSLRAAHGDEAVEELSGDSLAYELRNTYEGLMVATEPEHWTVFSEMSLTEFAQTLLKLAKTLDLTRDRKRRRGPKRPPHHAPNTTTAVTPRRPKSSHSESSINTPWKPCPSARRSEGRKNRIILPSARANSASRAKTIGFSPQHLMTEATRFAEPRYGTARHE